jgi:serine/threonine-protein kinase
VRAVLIGGRYRLEETIGRGGTASVWRAVDTTLDRPVAVKLLHSLLLDDPELAERFRREAQLVARLSHPHLVRLLDAGEEGDGPFLVFELVEGSDLKTLVRERGRLDSQEASRLCAQVARALACAHQRGVVHRDVKSRNVLVTPEGEAKLTDFGIARVMEGEAGRALTRTGMLMGSADYLAPEQAEGRPVDARADVYSLGVVLWECLTGRLPFRGDGFLAVAIQHIRDPIPDPRMEAPDVPDHLAAAVLRATAKRPDARYQRAEDLALALEEGETHQGTAPLPPRADEPDADTERVRRRRRPWPWVAAAGVLAAGAAAGALWGVGVLGGDDAAATLPSQTVALPLAAVRDHDPYGNNGSENPDLVPLVWEDHDPATAWYTERYLDSPRLADQDKPGVGLLIRLKRPAQATEMDIDSPTPGARFQVLGSGPDGSRPVYAEGTLTGQHQRVPLRVPRADRVYVLWFTELVPTPDDAGRYWAGVGQVSLRGPANS